MEAFLARQDEMVVLNAENHGFADEVQRAVANQPTVGAEGGILNPEHTFDPSLLEGTDGEDGTVNEDTLHDDNVTIGASSRQTLSERDYRQLVLSLNRGFYSTEL